MIHRLTCEHFFDGDILHGAHEIIIEDGLVTSVLPFSGVPEHFLISPGFIDLQVNGFDDIDVSNASAHDLFALGSRLREHGTTHWLATLTTAPREIFNRRISAAHEYISSQDIPGCIGIHLEGPHLGGRPGAHNPEWITSFTEREIESLPASVQLMTLAPEQPNAAQHVRGLTMQGISVSLGHTSASRQEFVDAVDAGALLVTHVFNGMTGVHHRDGGIALYALTGPRVSVGLIADLVHVSADAIRLTFAAKGSSSVVLVSDSIAWRSEKALKRDISIDSGAALLPNGTLAGSCVPLAHCMRNCVTSAGISLEDALRASTSSPADAMGWKNLGRIVTGQPVDINVLSEDLHVLETL